MNYIHRLENDVKMLQAALDAYDHGIDDIVRYLTSDKFEKDPTVQVQDVLNRISAARMDVTPHLDKVLG